MATEMEMEVEATTDSQRSDSYVRPKCCELRGTLRHYVELLRREARDLQAMEEDYNQLQAEYVGLLTRVASGIEHQLGSSGANAGSGMVGSWLRAEDSTREEMRRIQLVSRSRPNVLIPLLIKKVQQYADLAVRTLTEIKPHRPCKNVVVKLHKQAMALSTRMLEGPTTLQYLLYVTRTLPVLRTLLEQVEQLPVAGDAVEEAAPSEEKKVKKEKVKKEKVKKEADLYCGGPLFTKLTAEVCGHRCRPEELAAILKGEFSDKIPLIGMLEDELVPIKIPTLDPAIFKPLPD